MIVSATRCSAGACSRTSAMVRSLEVMRGPLVGLMHSSRRAFATTTSSSDKLKPMRDPERPKIPMTPYFLYLSDYRKKLPEGSTLKGKEVAVEAAQKWKSLVESEKAPFLSSYAQKKQL